MPVSDVDAAKAFYVDRAGFACERDVRVDEEHRFVELMPPGSPCAVALTTGYIDAPPGSLQSEEDRATGWGDQYMRFTVTFDAGAERYRWLNESVFVARGHILGTYELEYEIFRVT